MSYLPSPRLLYLYHPSPPSLRSEPFQCNGLPLGQRRSLLDTAKFRALGLGPAPHVIFVGMAFLWPRQLTIDVDERRMKIV